MEVNVTSIEAIINRQLLQWEKQQELRQQKKQKAPRPYPIITVSRQTGSRGSYFASRLAQRLDFQRLHREVIEEICRSSGYRKRLVESLDEHFRGQLDMLVESILTGQSFDHRDYIHHLTKVVLSMSRLGGVVLMGRGGSFIVGPHRGFHLRFIAPVGKRVDNLMKYVGLSKLEATERISCSDKGRREFIQHLFDADIDDPHAYDMVINSSLMDVEDLVEVVMRAVEAKIDKLTYLDHDQPAA